MLLEVISNLAILNTVRRLSVHSSIDVANVFEFRLHFISFLNCEIVKATWEVQDQHVAVAGDLSMVQKSALCLVLLFINNFL